MAASDRDALGVAFRSAAEHASQNVPVAAPRERAEAVRRRMIGNRYDSASHIVVCEGSKFAGIVTIEGLLAAADSSRIEDIMDADSPFVGPGVDQEIAAGLAVRNEAAALPVVDGDGRFVGVIPPHRLLAVLLSEHEEDLDRLGGFLQSTSVARAVSEEPVRRRFRHRLPWLLVGLAGALFAADLVGWFEIQLRETITLAFFIPGIVYLADAVGTQTETIVVRGLSIGVSIRRMIGPELLAGLAIGLALAALAGPLVWWHWGEPDLALTVALALFGACSTATIVAMTLPWLFNALGRDPAFGSGPVATVIQDLLSIVIYLVVAFLVVA